MLQNAATHCKTLQHTAKHCNTQGHGDEPIAVMHVYVHIKNSRVKSEQLKNRQHLHIDREWGGSYTQKGEQGGGRGERKEGGSEVTTTNDRIKNGT